MAMRGRAVHKNHNPTLYIYYGIEIKHDTYTNF